MGLRISLSAATHLLSAGSVTDLPLGTTTCPSPGLYGPSTMELECGVDLWLCPAGSCAPPLLGQNGVRRWAMGGLLTGLVYFVFLSRLGLMFPCPRVVCSLSAGVFSYGLHVCGGFFWFVVFRLGVSSVVSTHSTGVYLCWYSLLQFSLLPEMGRSCLYL